MLRSSVLLLSLARSSSLRARYSYPARMNPLTDAPASGAQVVLHFGLELQLAVPCEHLDGGGEHAVVREERRVAFLGLAQHLEGSVQEAQVAELIDGEQEQTLVEKRGPGVQHHGGMGARGERRDVASDVDAGLGALVHAVAERRAGGEGANGYMAFSQPERLFQVWKGSNKCRGSSCELETSMDLFRCSMYRRESD